MKIELLKIQPYLIPMLSGAQRAGVYLQIISDEGRRGWGEIAPLPNWSLESLEDALGQLDEKKDKIVSIDWNEDNCFEHLKRLKLYPSLSFGLESAMLSILTPLPGRSVHVSAWLTGTVEEIMQQADIREKEGFTTAKLKVGHLTLPEAFDTIMSLKDRFRLRIDVNRAWKTPEALDFFASFPVDAFDYVEEPFQNPHDLVHFTHPLAVDESYPTDLSLDELVRIPKLKALIYKPTIQGGLLNLRSLHSWTESKGISLVLSSCMESYLGLAYIACLAQRLSLKAPVGIGTYFYMSGYTEDSPLSFRNGALVKS